MVIRDLITKKKFSQEINEAIQLQNESSFYITRDINNPFSNDFRSRVLSIYNKDEYKTKRFFEAFSGKSLPSIEVCETIFSELYRVYDSQNQNSEYNFKDSDKKADAIAYLSDNFWKNQYWEALKYHFNSFLVVDLPVEQKKTMPEPYVFILDVSRVQYIDIDKNGIKEIIFTEKVEEEGKEKIYHYYYTSEFYSKYFLDGDLETLIFQNPHKLGRCPVEFIFPEKLNKGVFLRKGALVPNLDDLFWYNFKMVESRKSDLLYLNPTMQRPKQSCGFDGKTQGSEHIKGAVGKCVGGWLYSSDSKPILEKGKRVLCPICGENKHGGGGAGNTIDIDLEATAIKDGKVDPTRQMISFITPEIEGTVKQHEWIEDAKTHIIKSVVGEEQTQSKEAINEKQVKASYESKEGILTRLAANISYVRARVEWMILKLRYAEGFTSNTFFLGSEFYLKSVEDLQIIRKNSTDPIQKKQIDEQIIEVKYRNNPTKLERERLLYKLLPYSTLTDSEFIALAGVRITDALIIDLRFQFTDCVMAFESQLGSIIEFYKSMNENLTESNKILTLKKQLSTYVQNQIPVRTPDQPGAN
jgi:hypothetical protein